MNRKKAFTLIEVLFVVIVLAALAGLAIPRIFRTIRQSQIDTDRANISIINSQIELFRLRTGAYPVDNASFNTDVLQNTDYFGEVPTCPFATVYTYNATNNRVDAAAHAHP
ncbi:MAG: prepilin-type N-terminal cleavage/methylation domain-containing protein [Candidatus Omnitrophota bacterium]